MHNPPETAQRLSLELQGLVQGVGFRPHVVRLAQRHGLRGTVCNSAQGVQLELEGPRRALEAFRAALLAQPPERARIDHASSRWGPALGATPGVAILAPQRTRGGSALVSPDLAICPSCLAELSDPTNRRHGYPFISCTHCGPRYSVVEQLPFEREHTSFRHFPLCPQCQSEFSDPSDRRFHAQTISCPHCGPQLQWDGHLIGSGEAAEAAIQAAAEALAAGAVVALQGVGGFQLLVDPANAAAVQHLRQRKGRPDKPLALLATSAWMERHCRSNAGEREQWHGPAAPIVLLRRNPDQPAPLAAEVAGNSPWLGVMRPCSGLQHLLLEACGGVVVATSANRSGEPLCADAVADADVLRTLADHVLSHTLPVVNRIDDSVIRWAAGGPLVLRLGRGLAPVALPNPSAATEAAFTSGSLALGAQIKGAFALQTASHRLLSPDLGDLSSVAGAAHHQQSCRQWLKRHGLAVNRLVCDQHPGYSSSTWAEAWANRSQLPLRQVQHHHAHLLAVMAEHPINGNALGVAWDGSGQGDDGSLWGGEALRISANGYERIAHLRPWPLPGGERAQREPRRALLGLLLEAYGSAWRNQLPPLPKPAFSEEELQVLEQSVQRGINAPRCSSIGRLFDAVAALLGLAQRCSFEAQAALALEALAMEAEANEHGSYGLLQMPLQRLSAQEPWQWNWQPLLEQLLEALKRGTPAPALALAFHQALAEAIAALAEAEGCEQLLLAGGCFQNALLLELTASALNRHGCQALWPQQLPCNDTALPIGQLLAAETMPINGVASRAASDVPGRCR